MKVELYINGKNAWENWSVRLIENSYENLMLSANPKSFVENKNRSEHGTRVLVDQARIDERTVQIMFGITCDTIDEYLEKYDSLIAELNSGWVQLKVLPLKKVYNLLVSDYLSLSSGIGIKDGKLSVRFREPNPDDRSAIRFYTVLATNKGKVLQTENEKIIIKG